MTADICDEDELVTGLRREGAYVAVGGFFGKVAQVATLLLAGALPRMAGYVDMSVPPALSELKAIILLATCRSSGRWEPCSMEVVCAGNLVADIFASPIAALPAAGQLSLTERFLFGAAGCATNTAACLCKLGRTAKVLGKVGDDVFGSFVIEDLTQLFREAKKRSLATFLDVVIPSGLSISSEQVAAMLAYTDVVLPNDNEAYALTGLREPRAQAGYLARMNPATRDKRYPRTIGLPRSCTST
ncbi:MAG: PfkB family carbohydrate kinase [Terrimicrobiaceae bacterium]